LTITCQPLSLDDQSRALQIGIFACFILKEKTSKLLLELLSQAPMTSFKNSLTIPGRDVTLTIPGRDVILWRSWRHLDDPRSWRHSLTIPGRKVLTQHLPNF